MKKVFVFLISTLLFGCTQAGPDGENITDTNNIIYGTVTLNNPTYNRLAYRVDNINNTGSFTISGSTVSGADGFLNWNDSISRTEETGAIIIQWAITDPIVSAQTDKTFTLTETGYTVNF